MQERIKIDYIRNVNVSHMVLEQKVEPAAWEKEMIVHNDMTGILFGESVSENGRTELWYDITGKQALDVQLETCEINYEFLCQILEEIYAVTEHLGEFLLNQNDLLLQPEGIFWDYQSGEFNFCYYPGNGEALPEAFGRLAEYFLTRLDHRDERAVVLAYDLYEQTRMEGYSLITIRQMLSVPFPKEDVQAKNLSVEGDRNRETERLISKVSEIKVRSDMEGSQNFFEESEGISERVEKSGGSSRWELLGGNWNIWFFAVRDYLIKLFSFGKWRMCLKRKSEHEGHDDSFVFEPEVLEQGTNPTVLLADLTKRPEGILRYEGSGDCGDLRIEKLPYLIGSDESVCDGYISSCTISRKHARITKTEDVYFIEDLNSSNGTFVGGELLNYREKMSLKKNVTVVFADAEFRFI